MIDDLSGTADTAADQLSGYQKESHGKGLDQCSYQQEGIILSGFPAHFNGADGF